MVDVSTETIKKKTLKVTFACQTDAVKECTIKAHDGATERLDELLAKNQRYLYNILLFVTHIQVCKPV